MSFPNKEIRREFVFERDERFGEEVSRCITILRLSVCRRDAADKGVWSTEVVYSESFGIDDTPNTERQARDHFAKMVRQFWTAERAARAGGLFAETRFTKGSFIADG